MDAKLDIKQYMQQLGQAARRASRVLARAQTKQKNQALLAIADAILAQRTQLLAENSKDLDLGRENGLDDALLDRLALNDARVEAMAEGVRQVAQLPDVTVAKGIGYACSEPGQRSPRGGSGYGKYAEHGQGYDYA